MTQLQTQFPATPHHPSGTTNPTLKVAVLGGGNTDPLKEWKEKAINSFDAALGSSAINYVVRHTDKPEVKLLTGQVKTANALKIGGKFYDWSADGIADFQCSTYLSSPVKKYLKDIGVEDYRTMSYAKLYDVVTKHINNSAKIGPICRRWNILANLRRWWYRPKTTDLGRVAVSGVLLPPQTTLAAIQQPTIIPNPNPQIGVQPPAVPPPPAVPQTEPQLSPVVAQPSIGKIELYPNKSQEQIPWYEKITDPINRWWFRLVCNKANNGCALSKKIFRGYVHKDCRAVYKDVCKRDWNTDAPTH